MAAPTKYSEITENHCKESTVHLEIPFPTAKEAEIACNTLSVDKEPKRGGCTKCLCTDGDKLIVTFAGGETKKLRVAVNSFFESLHLVVRTLDRFGPPKPT